MFRPTARRCHRREVTFLTLLSSTTLPFLSSTINLRIRPRVNGHLVNGTRPRVVRGGLEVREPVADHFRFFQVAAGPRLELRHPPVLVADD
ncbi:hypothetical protein DPMN_183659 [Dreissena polymorpha]|uniref:Uncharacterized protein n=1 Tax=Dreissena polymorpha TaxID=45954 RepID=A0A9D4I6J5_DREPO|nr:hypothetical protein DPMN_183659 [Dreissena polymorpha]